MIVSQTPLRISFAGGGTDIQSFYTKSHGSVVSTAIDKFIYVIVKERFDEKIRVGYSKTELVDSADEIEHDLVREAMKMTGVAKGVEIATMADIPSEGSGLGSSSSVTVGLLNALYAFKGVYCPTDTLAKQACEIEIDILGKPIGKQDQYIAAYGGVRHFQFFNSHHVSQNQILLLGHAKQYLSECLMLFYTGVTRKADNILSDQIARTESNMETLKEMRDQSEALAYQLETMGNIEAVGEALREGWQKKVQLSRGISNDQISDMVKRAMEAGASGAKITGAGGGGFLLLYVSPKWRGDVREALKGYRELPITIGQDGSKIIFNVRGHN
jgi:D-glycero-alpha-D-manno-heptose-7-phosphate kinase